MTPNVFSQHATGRSALVNGAKVGSGVLLRGDSSDYILTAAHVVNECARPTCRVSMSDGKTYPLFPIAEDHESDWALLALRTRIELMIDVQVKVVQRVVYGADARIVGYPLGNFIATGQGPLPYTKRAIIAGFDTASPRDLYLDCHLPDGMSGSAVWSQDLDGSFGLAGIAFERLAGQSEERGFLEHADMSKAAMAANIVENNVVVTQQIDFANC